MEYSLLKLDLQRAMLKDRIQGDEQQHFAHSMTLTMANAWPQDVIEREGTIAAAASKIVQLETGLAKLREQLAALPATAETPAGEGDGENGEAASELATDVGAVRGARTRRTAITG